MKAVVDASVVVRALIPGQPFHDETRAWLSRQRELVAPRLLWYEVLTALRRLEHAGLLDPATVDAIVAAALELPVKVTAARHLFPRALAIARQLGMSRTHDAAYLAIAADQGIPLATLDERLIRNAQAHGFQVVHPGQSLHVA